MKQNLQTRLAQQLVLTPRLQQSIKLLQLSAVELDEEIELRWKPIRCWKDWTIRWPTRSVSYLTVPSCDKRLPCLSQTKAPCR